MNAPAIRLDLLRPRLRLIDPLPCRNARHGGNRTGECDAGNVMAKIAPKTAEGKGVNVSELRRLAAKEAIASEQKRLDPQTDVAAILDRILTLAIRARKLNRELDRKPKEDTATDNGLESIEHIAGDLRLLFRPYAHKDMPDVRWRGDVKDRHGRALEEILDCDPLLIAHNALLNVSRSFRQDATCEIQAEEVDPEHVDPWTDETTVEAIRGSLGRRIAPRVTSETILESAREYRKQWVGMGRKRAGHNMSTEKSRALAAVRLIEVDPNDNKDYSRRLREVISGGKSRRAALMLSKSSRK